MLSPELRALAGAVAQTRLLLTEQGDKFTAERMQRLEDRLNRADLGAIVSAYADAAGGMGTLNDCRFWAEDREDVNDRMRALITEVAKLARLAAAAHEVRLGRWPRFVDIQT